MYALLGRYFTNVSLPQFEGDLAEKEWSILLTNRTSGQLRGFSTLMRLSALVDGEPAVALFSGDTVIARKYWGETALARTWAQHVFAVADSVQDARVYWFLICSGYRTYRFLPTFFREFYPSCHRPTPPGAKRLMDALAASKFPQEYDPVRGVVRPAHATPLRPGVGEITQERLRDPHVAFFAAANPGHVAGEELVCLTQIARDNLTRAGHRMLEASVGVGT
jgi:hypothetical protein